jgi:hypothetical protein
MPAWLLNPFQVTEGCLQTQLSPEECRRRLLAQRASWFMARVDASTVRGTVSSDRFAISRSPGYGNRNPVQRVARGRYVAVPGGTRILVRLTLDPSAALLLLPVLGVLLALWLRDAGLDVAAALPYDAAIYAALFVAALYGLGCWLVRHDDALLLAFLCRTLDAWELPSEAAPTLNTSSVR